MAIITPSLPPIRAAASEAEGISPGSERPPMVTPLFEHPGHFDGSHRVRNWRRGGLGEPGRENRCGATLSSPGGEGGGAQEKISVIRRLVVCASPFPARSTAKNRTLALSGSVSPPRYNPPRPSRRRERFYSSCCRRLPSSLCPW